MRIECVGKSFIYRWPGGEVSLEPGKPIELPDERATRLLKKAGARARRVLPTIQPGDRITWQRADLSLQHGIVDNLHTDAEGTTWAFVTVGESWVALNLKVVTVLGTDTVLMDRDERKSQRDDF